MNNKTAIKYRIIFYICMIAAVVCLIVGFCTQTTVNQGGWYTGKYSVAMYIYKYHELPPNFITKSEASNIMDANIKRQYNMGGDTFYNKEGHIDNPNNIRLVECDIYTGNCNITNRGTERIVFFSDGSLVLYTSDHYATFTPVTMWSIMWNINTFSCVMFTLSGVLLLTQLLVAIFATIYKRKDNINGFTQWLVSLEVMGVIVLIVAFSPVLLVLYVVDAVIQRRNKLTDK